MKCPQYREWIQESCEGGLTYWQEEALRTHLRACPDCRRTSLSLQRVIAYLEEALWVQPPVDFASLVLERIACEPEKPAFLRRWLVREGGLRPIPLFVLWTGLGLVLLWGIGLWTGRPPEEAASPLRFWEAARQWVSDPTGLAEGLIWKGEALWETCIASLPAALSGKAVFYLLLFFLLDLALIASGAIFWLRRKSLPHLMI